MDEEKVTKGEKLLSVDEWTQKLKDIENIGEMTHWERLAKALDLEEPDTVPVLPELDYWPAFYLGYTSRELFEGPEHVEKRTHSFIKAWSEFRYDSIWQYFDFSEVLDPFIPPEKRKDHYVFRGPKDYIVYKPVVTKLDDAIKLFQDRVWEKYGYGHADATFTPHIHQLLEFQNKMNKSIPVITGMSSVFGLAETIVEVHRLVKWLITEPKQKLHDYFEFVLQQRLDSLDFYRDYVAKFGCEFFCAFGGGRTWGPKQWQEFGEYEEIYLEKIKRIFRYPFWHVCGHNLKETLTFLVTKAPGIKGIQYDFPMSQYEMSWPEWFKWVAKLCKDRRCAMNAPTTQMAMYGTPQEIKQMVKAFIKYTTPYTTAAVTPACSLSGYTPTENIKAIVEAAREYGKYPISI